MRLLITIAWLALLLAANGARAQGPADITEGELALLPLFCRDTLGMPKTNFTPGFNHWMARVGEGFKSMHHYCWARINMRRIYAPGTDRAFRIGRLGGVVADLFFVIRNSPPDFVMLPEIYSSLAEVELLRQDPATAFGHVQTALRLKPSYGPIYRVWGDHLVSVGKKSEAREWFKNGLEYNPGDRALRERYQALGGDPARIVARPPPAADAPARVQPAAPGTTEAPASAPAVAGSAAAEPASR